MYSFSEGEDERSIIPAGSQRKAMSQPILDTEEVEIEFLQCLSLYGFAPSRGRGRKSNGSRSVSGGGIGGSVDVLSHSMSQVVRGRYGQRSNDRRNRRHSIRPPLIRKSQNNPWDRKLIDFLKNIPSICMIEHYRNDDSDDEEPPSSKDWIDASLAINCCVSAMSISAVPIE